MSQFNIDEQTLSDRRYQFGWEVASNDLENGWEYIKQSEYPHLFSEIDDGDDLIKRGGMLAVRRPIELKEREDQHFEELEMQQWINVMEEAEKNGLLVTANIRTKHAHIIYDNRSSHLIISEPSQQIPSF